MEPVWNGARVRWSLVGDDNGSRGTDTARRPGFDFATLLLILLLIFEVRGAGAPARVPATAEQAFRP
jgi:hypothetical protein